MKLPRVKDMGVQRECVFKVLFKEPEGPSEFCLKSHIVEISFQHFIKAVESLESINNP